MQAMAEVAGAPWTFTIAFVGFYGTMGLIEPVHYELLHESIPTEVRATMLSVGAPAEQLGGVASSLTLPRLAAGAGIPAAWWILTGVLLAVALVARALPKSRRRPGELAL
jgi:hypothetical protein